VVQALIDACGHEVLYMLFDTLQLISFYKTFGFVPIPEDQLPRMIRERFHLPLRRDGGVQRMPHAEGGDTVIQDVVRLW
jgi:N-acetylglutamate synthase-like GNAT family acetyltransferase